MPSPSKVEPAPSRVIANRPEGSAPSGVILNSYFAQPPAFTSTLEPASLRPPSAPSIVRATLVGPSLRAQR